MKNYGSMLLAPALLSMLACEPVQVEKQIIKTESPKVELPKKMTTQKSLSESDRDFNKRLLRMGEILAQSPVGFVHAQSVFDKILEKDPGNDKALFYSALLDTVKVYKGMGAKSKEYYDSEKAYRDAVKTAQETYYPEIKEFLFSGNGESYKNMAQVQQGLFKSISKNYQSALNKLERIDEDVELIATQVQADSAKSFYDCHTYLENEMEITECKGKEEIVSTRLLPSKRFVADMEDIKVLSASLKAVQSYARLLGAYTLEGQEDITADIQQKEKEFGRELTDIEAHRIVKEKSKYLTLAPDNELAELRSGLIETVEIGMDLESLNNRFCENGLRKMNLVKSICFSADARESMQKTLEFLYGPKEIELGKDESGEPVRLLVDLPAFLNNPVRDLKSMLKSMDYDAEGNGYLSQEPEMGGLFPNKDYLQKIHSLRNASIEYGEESAYYQENEY